MSERPAQYSSDLDQIERSGRDRDGSYDNRLPANQYIPDNARINDYRRAPYPENGGGYHYERRPEEPGQRMPYNDYERRYDDRERPFEYRDKDRDYQRDAPRIRDEDYRMNDRDRYYNRDYRDRDYERDYERNYNRGYRRDYRERDYERDYRNDDYRDRERYHREDRDRDRRPHEKPEPPLYDWERKDYVPPPPISGPIDWNYKSDAIKEEAEPPKPDRTVKVVLRHNARRFDPSTIPELSDAFYRVRPSDIIAAQKGAQELALAKIKEEKEGPRRIARVRFYFDGPYSDLAVDATFSPAELCENIYNFLQGEVFMPDTSLRVFTPFPVRQVANNNRQTLGGFGVSGNIILSVQLGDKAFLTKEMGDTYAALKAEDAKKKEEEKSEEK